MTAVLALAPIIGLAAVPGSVSPIGPASTIVALPQPAAGIDISFPQCLRDSHVDLPENVPFAVVGVNGGSAFNVNPCFASEYHAAFLLNGTSDQPHAALYVNTGNPALAGVWWPSSDHTRAGTAVDNPNGSCDHQPGAACAYVYGYSMAQADYRRVDKTLVQVPDVWWLDVETSNTWQPDVVANAASLSGMVDFFQAQELQVGLYSTSYQWNRIAGSIQPTSNLAGLPSWLAGGSFFGAPVDCEKSPLTPGGRVAMVQYVMHFDSDFSCHRFGASIAAISPGRQSVVGTQLNGVTGDWGPADVTFAYQWSSNGVAIAGATSEIYVPTAADAGATLTVTITGSAPGFSTDSRTSEGVAILAATATS